MRGSWQRLLADFGKCGVAGWCLEVMFTSVDSILAGDFRLMGHTSLLMFPIYGLGAFAAPVSTFLDAWLSAFGPRPDTQAWTALYGAYIHSGIYNRDMAQASGHLPMGLFYVPGSCKRSDPPAVCAAVVWDRALV